ncbi:hypothetical protein [Hydrogenophaga sp.]
MSADLPSPIANAEVPASPNAPHPRHICLTSHSGGFGALPIQ